MYLLYADESGTTHDPVQQYFVLAGFCIFERQGYWISNELDQIASRFDPADPGSIELHGSPMFDGRICLMVEIDGEVILNTKGTRLLKILIGTHGELSGIFLRFPYFWIQKRLD